MTSVLPLLILLTVLLVTVRTTAAQWRGDVGGGRGAGRFGSGTRPPSHKRDSCCRGSVGYGGSAAPVPLAKNCLDIREFGGGRDGVYSIYVSDLESCSKREVYCDQQRDGGGWTVIQRRYNGNLNFFRGWDDYVKGFGFLDGEFWLGLEWIHLLTHQGPTEVRVELQDFQFQEVYAHYQFFSVSDGASNYTLTVQRYESGSSAGDGLSPHSGMPFSTFDRDHDRWSGNCALEYTGAWWYTSCHTANLNGKYLHGATGEYAKGVVWNPWKGYSYSLKFAEIKIRPLPPPF
ncbi:microfibril-associated glycoprotein 4-like [Diadema setosum]|uniref:microfibril-associated glycoprotein 4-like n=1 Tax=Diadema setosum TaxID=31175 RepID=UPI003B3A33F0